jgi:hypothetical protein
MKETVIWFWASGFGYFRGLLMRKKEFKIGDHTFK